MLIGTTEFELGSGFELYEDEADVEPDEEEGECFAFFVRR